MRTIRVLTFSRVGRNKGLMEQGDRDSEYVWVTMQDAGPSGGMVIEIDEFKEEQVEEQEEGGDTPKIATLEGSAAEEAGLNLSVKHKPLVYPKRRGPLAAKRVTGGRVVQMSEKELQLLDHYNDGGALTELTGMPRYNIEGVYVRHGGRLRLDTYIRLTTALRRLEEANKK